MNAMLSDVKKKCIRLFIILRNWLEGLHMDTHKFLWRNSDFIWIGGYACVSQLVLWRKKHQQGNLWLIWMVKNMIYPYSKQKSARTVARNTLERSMNQWNPWNRDTAKDWREKEIWFLRMMGKEKGVCRFNKNCACGGRLEYYIENCHRDEDTVTGSGAGG